MTTELTNGQYQATPELPTFPWGHPLRVALDRASRAWQLRALDGIRDERLTELAQAKQRVWTLAGNAPSPLRFELQITNIQTPSTWAPGQKVIVEFALTNNSSQTTSGFVHGTMTRAIWTTLLYGHWFQSSASVKELAAGQSFSGAFSLSSWQAFPPAAGPVDVTIDYWVEDPQGTICFIFPAPLDPGNQRVATYAVAASAEAVAQVPLRSFAKDIRPLFRQRDIDCMVDIGFDLGSYDVVKKFAGTGEIGGPSSIYALVASGRMPTDIEGRWSREWVAIFKQWIDQGMLP